MRRLGIRRALTLLATLVAWAGVAGPAQAAVGDIAERTVPGSTGMNNPDSGGLNRIVNGPDGNLWFTDGGTNAIGRMTPAGAFTRFPVTTTDGNPQDITTGPDGALWFTEGAGKIGRITTSGQITEFPVTGRFPSGITNGPDGALWFIVDDGDPTRPSAIGRITTAGAVTFYPVAAGTTTAVGITTGPDGNLWYTVTAGDNRIDGRIQRMDRSGKVTGDFSIPTPFSDPSRLVTGPDGNLWFTEQGAVGGNLSPGKVGRITPSGQITEFETPNQNPPSNPAGIAVGADGNLWFTEYSYLDGTQPHGGNRIGRITTAGVITEFRLPTPYSRADGITAGPPGDRHLYFTEGPNDFAFSAVGSIEGGAPPSPPSPVAPGPVAPPAIGAPAKPAPARVVLAQPRRVSVAGFTARVAPRRDRRAPYRFTVSGRVLRPAGIGAAACKRGRVSVQTKVGARTVSTRRVTLRSDCSYRVSVTFHDRRRLGRGRLTLSVRFLGNARFKPAATRRLSARAG